MLFLTLLIFVFKTVVVTKLVVSDILFSTSAIFVFKTVVVTKSLVSGIFYQNLEFFSLNCVNCAVLNYVNESSCIFFSTLFTFILSVLNSVFLTTSLSTTSLNFFKSTGTDFSLLTCKSFTS